VARCTTAEALRTAAMQAQQRNRSARTTVLVDGVAVPAVRLARLASHNNQQGQGLRERLLTTAVRDVLAAAEHVVIVLMTVDAIDGPAAAFSERCGLVCLEVERARPAAQHARSCIPPGDNQQSRTFHLRTRANMHLALDPGGRLRQYARYLHVRA